MRSTGQETAEGALMGERSDGVGAADTGEAAAPPLPRVVDRSAFDGELDRLREREEGHTHEGDARPAPRRRLPMVEVDAGLELHGPDGSLPLLDAFEGRRQL